MKKEGRLPLWIYPLVLKYELAGAEMTLVSGRRAWAEYACPRRFVFVLLPLVMLMTNSPFLGLRRLSTVTLYPCASRDALEAASDDVMLVSFVYWSSLTVGRCYFSTPPQIFKLCHIVQRLLVRGETDEAAVELVIGPVADCGA